jgi:hypothetical protein
MTYGVVFSELIVGYSGMYIVFPSPGTPCQNRFNIPPFHYQILTSTYKLGFFSGQSGMVVYPSLPDHGRDDSGVRLVILICFEVELRIY